MTMKGEYRLQTGQTAYGPTEKPIIEIQNGGGQRVLDLNQHGQHSSEERLFEEGIKKLPWSHSYCQELHLRLGWTYPSHLLIYLIELCQWRRECGYSTIYNVSWHARWSYQRSGCWGDVWPIERIQTLLICRMSHVPLVYYESCTTVTNNFFLSLQCFGRQFCWIIGWLVYQYLLYNYL